MRAEMLTVLDNLTLLQELTGELVHQDALLETFLQALTTLFNIAAGDDSAASTFASAASRRRSADHTQKPVNVQHHCIGGQYPPRLLANQ